MIDNVYWNACLRKSKTLYLVFFFSIRRRSMFIYLKPEERIHIPNFRIATLKLRQTSGGTSSRKVCRQSRTSLLATWTPSKGDYECAFRLLKSTTHHRTGDVLWSCLNSTEQWLDKWITIDKYLVSRQFQCTRLKTRWNRKIKIIKDRWMNLDTIILRTRSALLQTVLSHSRNFNNYQNWKTESLDQFFRHLFGLIRKQSPYGCVHTFWWENRWNRSTLRQQTRSWTEHR